LFMPGLSGRKMVFRRIVQFLSLFLNTRAFLHGKMKDRISIKVEVGDTSSYYFPTIQDATM
jgi:hypothetical protein